MNIINISTTRRYRVLKTMHENITSRKKNRNLNLSNIELISLDCDSNSETLNSSSRSFPLSHAVPEEVLELKTQMLSIRN